MNKVIFSLVLALSVAFSAFVPVVYASAAEPPGDLQEANIGDVIDTAADVVDFVSGVIDVITSVNAYFSGENNAGVDEIKGVIDDLFVGFIETGVSMLPGGDFINLILGWLGLNDFSITGYFGKEVQDLCDSNAYLMQDFYTDYMLPCYGSVDTFVDEVYGDRYTPVPVDPVSSSGEAVASIGSGAGSFISGVLSPLGDFCLNSEICLAFLAVSFAALGGRLLRRSVGAFGRGR